MLIDVSAGKWRDLGTHVYSLRFRAHDEVDAEHLAKFHAAIQEYGLEAVLDCISTLEEGDRVLVACKPKCEHHERVGGRCTATTFSLFDSLGSVRWYGWSVRRFGSRKPAYCPGEELELARKAGRND